MERDSGGLCIADSRSKSKKPEKRRFDVRQLEGVPAESGAKQGCVTGYRICFGRAGETLIVLLGGGTKRRQRGDIETASRLWRDYRRRRQED